MRRIRKKFLELKREGRAALIPYVTPEFPRQGVTIPLVYALEDAGADLIELGVPFSDPIADGPTIQHSSYVALRNGVTLRKVLGIVSEIRRNSSIPIILMGYYNSFLHYNLKNFFSDAVDAGVDGVIVPDLPPEESGPLRTARDGSSLGITFLIAPTTPSKRIAQIDRLSTDFSYCVSLTGVTGARRRFGGDAEFEKFLRRVRWNARKPFVVGFGVSRREHVKAIAQYADGVVVGSALIQSMENSRSVRDAVKLGARFLGSLRG